MKQICLLLLSAALELFVSPSLSGHLCLCILPPPPAGHLRPRFPPFGCSGFRDTGGPVTSHETGIRVTVYGNRTNLRHHGGKDTFERVRREVFATKTNRPVKCAQTATQNLSTSRVQWKRSTNRERRQGQCDLAGVRRRHPLRATHKHKGDSVGSHVHTLVLPPSSRFRHGFAATAA